jgi:hypothetical protein
VNAFIAVVGVAISAGTYAEAATRACW